MDNSTDVAPTAILAPAAPAPAYTPEDWYFRAEDGRLFSTARIALVPTADAAFAAWTAARGHAPSLWPRDGAGAQSTDALQAALAPHGLHASLQAYAAMVRWRAETGGVRVGQARIATDAESQAKIGGAYQLLQASGAASLEFKTLDGFATLTADQFRALALAVGAHVQACYAREAAIDAGLSAVPPTIADRAGVDAAFADLTLA